MKDLHLLCNAHLDPAWLWRWHEGLVEAISTFRVAADFCEQYDNFVFNHNEALLYAYIEEHEPALFARIQKLVKEKKWFIIGGWYLQPDCVMTSGESLLEQIELGKEYFLEKFGVIPETAVNFDSFGHSRGLVQILHISGYKNYLFMRPEKTFQGDFIWEGFDGSQIVAHGLLGAYSSQKGRALEALQQTIDADLSDVGLRTWGIGNHGGGPSKIDLEAINEYIKTSDIRIFHSTADAYFQSIDKSALKTVDTSLIPCMIGCYTSMVQIKQAHRRLENKIAVTEKILSYAKMGSDFSYDSNALKKAKQALAFCQFHDILPGTGIRSVEEDSLRTLSFGQEIVDKLYHKAFIKLCEGQEKTPDGMIPIMVCNPHPYPVEGIFTVEFLLQAQNRNEGEITIGTVYDENGNPLPTQNEKPESTLNLDWVKKISFNAKIAPSSISRFHCKLQVMKQADLIRQEYPADAITIDNGSMRVSISRKTGLIRRYEVNGKCYIENSGILEVYRDNEDPWAMQVDSFKNYAGSFRLMDTVEANVFTGYPEETVPGVRVVEDGPVRTKVEALFTYGRNTAVIEYTIPKQSTDLDVNVIMYSNEPNVMIKYRIDSAMEGTPYGETAFGYEKLFDDERESVFHKWCGLKNGDDALYVINNGIHGGSFTSNTMKLSLLRTPIYAAHPIQKKQIAPKDRFLNHIDMGERRFSFKITTKKDIARQAQIYNEVPELFSFFPSGEGKKKNTMLTIDNREIILSAIKNRGDHYELHLYNAADHENDATLSAATGTTQLHFRQHELKFLTI